MKWEYKIVKLDGSSILFDAGKPTEEELNKLGNEDWEFATSLTGSKMGLGGRGSSTTELVFKRPSDPENRE